MIKHYPLNPIDYYSTFRDFTEGIQEKFREKKAISWFTRKQEEKSVTYGVLCHQAACLRAALSEMGLQGKHIAIVGENSYEWLLVYLAVVSCGSVAVCIDTEQAEETIHQMLEMADAEAAFVSASCLDICKRAVKEEGLLKKLVLLSGGECQEDIPTVDRLIADGEEMEEKGRLYRPEAISPEQTAAIVFTSGTTSLSKPVMLSQKALLTNASDADAYVLVGDVAFTSLPFYHTYGMTCSVLAMLIKGVHLYINGNLKTVMRDIHLANPHTMFSVPLMLEAIHNQIWLTAEKAGKEKGLRKLLQMQRLLYKLGIKKQSKTIRELKEKVMGTLRLIICGGAHMSREIMEEFELLGITVVQGYGITECAPLVSVNRNEGNKLDSVGLVMPHCEVKIENEEILVRGDNVMNGYYKSPDLTKEVMTGEWFHTGDIGEFDKDGYLFITGRKKNLVVFKNGKKVSPEKLEEKIKQIPLVKDVMVYGAASGESADDVKLAASIYPDPERSAGMTSYEILEGLQAEIDKINDVLPFYQQIQMVNIREQEFSKTAMHKIKRHLV